MGVAAADEHCERGALQGEADGRPFRKPGRTKKKAHRIPMSPRDTALPPYRPTALPPYRRFPAFRHPQYIAFTTAGILYDASAMNGADHCTFHLPGFLPMPMRPFLAGTAHSIPSI